MCIAVEIVKVEQKIVAIATVIDNAREEENK